MGSWDAAFSHLWDAMYNIHGHNFRVIVDITTQAGDEDWLVDDVELANVVLAWDNKNLSVLPEFLTPEKRATTERMAHMLCERIAQLVEAPAGVHVIVHETNDIYAAATLKRE